LERKKKSLSYIFLVRTGSYSGTMKNGCVSHILYELYHIEGCVLGFGNIEEGRGDDTNYGIPEEFQFHPLIRQQRIPFVETLLSKSDSCHLASRIIFSTSIDIGNEGIFNV
jgi:hypothetical protein